MKQTKKEVNEKTEQSLYEKIGLMNGLGNYLINIDLKNPGLFNETEKNEIYGVGDGLTEEFVMKLIERRCSLKMTLEWELARIELFVDDKINFLHNLITKGDQK